MTALPRRLELSADVELATGRLRLGAAVVSVLGAIWIALLSPPSRAWVWVVLGVLAGAMWVALYVRGRRRARDPGAHFLALDADGLRVVTPKTEQRVDWATVVGVTADEERLVVLVARTGGEPLALEPLYEGLGMYELEATVRDAWREATPLPVDRERPTTASQDR